MLIGVYISKFLPHSVVNGLGAIVIIILRVYFILPLKFLFYYNVELLLIGVGDFPSEMSINYWYIINKFRQILNLIPSYYP